MVQAARWRICDAKDSRGCTPLYKDWGGIVEWCGEGNDDGKGIGVVDEIKESAANIVVDGDCGVEMAGCTTRSQRVAHGLAHMTPQKAVQAGLDSLEFKERQPNKELLNLLPWKLSSIRHIQVKTITISKSCARNIALTRSKLKTYAFSNYYMYTTNMWSTRDKW